jgi:BirA family biotin operon repressor/biotin-[acetyl-CoA-carboxylase] ligase
MGADPDNRKVAGILLTSRLHGSGIDYVLVGIGVNVSSTAEDLPAGATSIRVASGASTTPDGLLETLLARFDRVYANYLAALGRPSLDSWRARAALIGEHVVVADGGQQVDGKFLGIDDDGALLLQESDATVRRIVAGNVTRGPRETGQSSGS